MNSDKTHELRKRRAIAVAARLEHPVKTPALEVLSFALVALAVVGYVIALSQ